MGADVSGIRHRRFVVGVLREELQDAVEDLELVPAGELGVNRLPWAETLGKIPPRSTGLGDVEHRVHEGAIGQLGRTRLATALGRQQRFDALPFLVAEFVASHIQR